MRIVYVIGIPGAGKSTALQSAIDSMDWDEPTQQEKPIPHLYYGNSTIQLGRLRSNGFGGTDALGMAINPQAIDFISTVPANLVIGEGDRLANLKFLRAAAEHGDLKVLWIDTDPHVAKERARQRARTLGVPEQSDTFRKSRLTKTLNLISQVPYVRIDGNQSRQHISDQIAQRLAR